MADELKRLMQESKERGPRQEPPLDESTLKSIAEEYDPISAWAAVSMAQEILRLRPVVEAIVELEDNPFTAEKGQLDIIKMAYKALDRDYYGR